MRSFKLSISIFSISLFFLACSSNQPPQVANVGPSATDDQTDYWAKDNLDLQRVGVLLERSKTPQEFEAYLNENDRINNLDLNGDGYVDYISVDEFEDRDDYGRGLSLYTRFGPDQVQEVATIVFYRDYVEAPGARIVVIGNDNIYGDNVYYETNWLDRSLAIASAVFTPRAVYYRSPYYYDYYPPDYVVYEVVDLPVYRTRVVSLFPEPVFVFTTTPTFFSKIKIKSPNNGLHLGQIKARLVKPTKEQFEFRKNNPGKPVRVKFDKPEKWEGSPPGHDKQPKEVRKVDVEKVHPSKPAKADKPGRSEKPQKSGNDGGKGKKKP